MEHGGAENGKLPVTYADFEKWGVRPNSIAGAIRTLEALGLIRSLDMDTRARRRSVRQASTA